MKVSHIEEFDSHSIIGGKVKTIQSFEIAQTAEFFTVLSSTLYSNKPLAVGREVLCNAWDAHKVSDRTDIPINIQLDENNLIIRDYGLGIHPDMMHPIYCVYGNSTKANDGNQTGGFGLGSKAPFAYSDHFTVTSYHQGIKTVYAISRGSALTQGKPDMRIIVQVPTSESGLEVNIPIKHPSDVKTFKGIIENIASFGEMNATLNNNVIPIVPISKAENGIFITSVTLPVDNQRINIRYGNVVYPVQNHPEYANDYHAIINQLDSIPGDRWNRGTWKMILDAPSNSISVTPSRESLSMTEVTIATIKSILAGIAPKFSVVDNKFKEKLWAYIPKIIDQFWVNGVSNKLLWVPNGGNPAKVSDSDFPPHLFNMDEVAEVFVTKSDNLPRGFNEQLYNAQLQSLIDNNYRRKQDIYRFKKILKHENKGRSRVDKTRFKREIINPIIRSIVKHPILDIKNMTITREKDWHTRSTLSIQFQPILEAKVEGNARNLLLQGVVVITSSRSAYDDHFRYKLFGGKYPHYVYITPRKAEHKEAAIKHFEKLGFFVIDFQSYYDSLTPVVSNAPVAVAKPKLKGLVTLESLIDNHGYFVRNGHRSDKVIHKRIINPEYVFQPHNLSGSEWDQKFFSFGDDKRGVNYGKMVVELIGSKGGIVANAPQYQTYMKKGAKDGYEYLVENIANEMLTNPRIRTYLEFIKIGEELPSGLEQFLSLAEFSPVLTKKYNLPDPLKATDNMYLALYDRMKDVIGIHPSTNWEKLMADKIKLVEDIKPSIATENLINKFIDNDLIKVIDWDHITHQFRMRPKLEQRISLEMFIIHALGT